MSNSKIEVLRMLVNYARTIMESPNSGHAIAAAGEHAALSEKLAKEMAAQAKTDPDPAGRPPGGSSKAA